MSENQRHVLGFPEMDIQHQYLYGLFDLIGTVQNSSGRFSLQPLLDEIELYVNFHFTSEENLMKLYEYPRFSAHQSDHELAAAKLVNFLEDYEKEQLNPAALRIFLTGWLMEHSETADSDYVNWIEQRRKAVWGQEPIKPGEY